MEEFVQMKERLVLPYLEMVITTKCNMRCINCSNNIPMIQHKARHISANEFQSQLSALTELVSRIDKFQIHGGEPLSNPELPLIAKLAIEEPSLRKIRIATNGTIPLTTELIGVLSGQRATIAISSYHFNKESKKMIVEQCEKSSIPYVLYGEQKWYRFADSLEGNNRMRFEDCPINDCLSYYDWRLYLCSRICHSTDNCTYSIDIRNANDLIKELSKPELKEWCKFCTIRNELVESGVQYNSMTNTDE